MNDGRAPLCSDMRGFTVQVSSFHPVIYPVSSGFIQGSMCHTHTPHSNDGFQKYPYDNFQYTVCM